MLGSLWGEGWSVWRAAKKARLDKLEEVLRSEVQPNMVVNRKHPMRGLTPLMAATSATNTTSVAGCVRVLISYGADVNAVDNTKHKNTALHYAACNNKASAIGILLDAGANAFARNVEGFTALDLAWKNGRREAARVLMKHVQLQSGWLNISTKITIPRWKRCWCVILARDSEYSSAELCVFDRPDHLRPDLILQFGSSSIILIPSWSPFEFHVDGVKMQHLGLRSSEVETTANQEVKCCHELAFATDEWKSPNDRRLWLKALRASCAFTTGGRRASRIKRQPDQSSQRDIGKRISELRPSSPISVGRRSSQE